MTPTWAVLSVAFLTLGGMPASQAPVAEVPLHFSAAGSTVEVHINGQGPFRLLVQADSEYTFITEETAAAVGLTPEEADGVRIARGVRLDLGGHSIQDLRLRVLPAEYQPGGADGPRGILGWGALRGYLWTVDFPRQKLVLGRGRLTAGEDESILPMRLHPSVGSPDAGQVPAVPIQIGEQTVHAEIHTTNQSALALPNDLAEKVPMQAPPGVIGHARTPDGQFEIKGASLATDLRIGDQRLEKPRARISDLYVHPGLGYEILREFAITFDHEEELVRLVRSEGVTDPQQARAAAVEEIAGDATLREAFNRDRGKVRLLMILSPT